MAGDTVLPEIDWSAWEIQESERHAADGKNNFDYSFETYTRR
ncbi:MAG: dihydrofolate reductase [Mariniblastus sp.]